MIKARTLPAFRARSPLTAGLASAKATPMRAALSLFTALLLLVTLAVGPAARASVPVPCGTVTASAADAHFEGDSDEVPADDDAGFPHHHGPSHDHQVGMALAGGESATLIVSASAPWARASAAHASSASDPALRPPRA